MKELLKTLLVRNLKQLKIEIESYKSENQLWLTTPEINNSGGNLCLHIIGNLNHFIGATLGNTSYIRQRDLEFSTKNISVNILVKNIEETEKIVVETLDNLQENRLFEDFPISVFETKMVTNNFLFYLTTHLTYHLGQINYHRRMINTSHLNGAKIK